MKKVLFCLSVSFLVLIGLFACDKRSDSNTEAQINKKHIEETDKGAKETSANTKQAQGLNDSIKGLITKSLDIQYGTNNSVELTKVYSDKFIKEIQGQQSFYKKDMKPYKIVNINFDDIKDEPTNNFIVFVRINDSKGEYTQIIHMTNENNVLIIDEIENDI